MSLQLHSQCRGVKPALFSSSCIRVSKWMLQLLHALQLNENKKAKIIDFQKKT